MQPAHSSEGSSLYMVAKSGVVLTLASAAEPQLRNRNTNITTVLPVALSFNFAALAHIRSLTILCHYLYSHVYFIFKTFKEKNLMVLIPACEQKLEAKI